MGEDRPEAQEQCHLEDALTKQAEAPLHELGPGPGPLQPSDLAAPDGPTAMATPLSLLLPNSSSAAAAVAGATVDPIAPASKEPNLAFTAPKPEPVDGGPLTSPPKLGNPTLERHQQEQEPKQEMMEPKQETQSMDVECSPALREREGQEEPPSDGCGDMSVEPDAAGEVNGAVSSLLVQLKSASEEEEEEEEEGQEEDDRKGEEERNVNQILLSGMETEQQQQEQEEMKQQEQQQQMVMRTMETMQHGEGERDMDMPPPSTEEVEDMEEPPLRDEAAEGLMEQQQEQIQKEQEEEQRQQQAEQEDQEQDPQPQEPKQDPMALDAKQTKAGEDKNKEQEEDKEEEEEEEGNGEQQQQQQQQEQEQEQEDPKHQESEQQQQSQQQQQQQQQRTRSRRHTRRRVAPSKLPDNMLQSQQQQPPQQQDGAADDSQDFASTAAAFAAATVTVGGGAAAVANTINTHVTGSNGSSKGVGSILPRGPNATWRLESSGTAGGASGWDSRPTKRSRTHQYSEERLQVDLVKGVGLEPFELSEEEEALLSDVEMQRPGQPTLGRQHYLKVRNLLLTMWRANARRHLSMEDACRAVPPQYTMHAEVAWTYLHSYGFINFGLATAAVPDMEHEETVIVIGAGLAGLAAAQQLRQLGYRVLVLEARTRAGGRVHTVRMESAAALGVVGFADLGGSVITGCDGNPLAALALQGGVPLHAVVDKTPLFWEDGRPVYDVLDEKVWKLFDEALSRCNHLGTRLGQAAGELVSAEAALNAIWPEMSSHLRRRQRRRCDGGEGDRSAHEGADEEEEEEEEEDEEEEEEAAKLVDQLFNWHVANMEFANAAQASRLSMLHWAQDDQYELLGHHAFVAGGNSRLVQLLTHNLPILYGSPVTEVRYGTSGDGGGDGGGGVSVVTESGQVFEASAAVVTLPLGVLKTEAVRFNPPLPKVKQEAIKRLGYGRMNKVAMLFPYAFWDTSIDTFACVMREKERRGAHYLFYCGAHTGGGAVLMALVAGSAAIAIESMSDDEAAAQVMTILRNIFDGQDDEEDKAGGDKAAAGGGATAAADGATTAAAAGSRRRMVPDPLQVVVTRWGTDPYSLGSYSSMAVSCKGAAEYQALAAPVEGRLFFAGEATIHKYPATMHGAFLSGLREAGRIHYTFARVRHGLPPRADGFTGAAEGGDLSALTAATAAADGGGGGPGSPLGTAAPPSGEALLRVRQMAALGGSLRALFSSGEPDLEFGCFKALFGPPPSAEWALVQIDLGLLRSRAVASGDADAEDGDAVADAGGRAGAISAGGRAGRQRRGGAGGAVSGGFTAAAGGSTAGGVGPFPGRPGIHRRRALVHLPLPKAAVEALWCLRGGDDARLVALTSRFGVKLPGAEGAETNPDWDPYQLMALLYEQLSRLRGLQPLPPALVEAAAAAAASAATAVVVDTTQR